MSISQKRLKKEKRNVKKKKDQKADKVQTVEREVNQQMLDNKNEQK